MTDKGAKAPEGISLVIMDKARLLAIGCWPNPVF